jgi:predicted metalloprotease with PDZ domain
MSSELWFAEGFTSYYGPLVLQRAGFSDLGDMLHGFAFGLDAVLNGAGRRSRSAVDASRMAPFTDGALSVDRTNFSNTYISYYTYGAVIALGLDLSLRDRTDSRVTLDDYMRALWLKFGKPGGPAPGLVAQPYTMRDLRDTLADVSQDRAFADRFFDRFIEGRDVVDYATLLGRAGCVLRKRYPGRGWIGDLDLDRDGDGVKIGRLVAPGTPAYAAGLEQDDVIAAVDNKPVATTADVEFALRDLRPGDRATIAYLRRGAPLRATVTVAEDPSLDLVLLEGAGGKLTPAQQTFRQKWLASRVN